MVENWLVPRWSEWHAAGEDGIAGDMHMPRGAEIAGDDAMTDRTIKMK
jgi:hypothetical protein